MTGVRQCWPWTPTTKLSSSTASKTWEEQFSNQPTGSHAIGNRQVADAVVINDPSLLANVDIATAVYPTIVACLDKAEIKGLAHPAGNAAPNYHGIASVLPAPWLLKAILGANTNDPSLIILAASKFATEFDNEHKNDVEYVTTGAEDHLKDFVKWAWGVQAGRIPRLNYIVEPGNKALLNCRLERHQLLMSQNYTLLPQPTNHLAAQPPPGIAPTVFNLLEASILRQANAMEKMNSAQESSLMFQREKEMKKKDRFTKFHPFTKQLILFASAPNTNNVPIEMEDTCKCFMNAATQGVAAQELNMQFKTMGQGDVAYTTGLTLNL